MIVYPTAKPAVNPRLNGCAKGTLVILVPPKVLRSTSCIARRRSKIVLSLARPESRIAVTCRRISPSSCCVAAARPRPELVSRPSSASVSSARWNTALETSRYWSRGVLVSLVDGPVIDGCCDHPAKAITRVRSVVLVKRLVILRKPLLFILYLPSRDGVEI